MVSNQRVASDLYVLVHFANVVFAAFLLVLGIGIGQGIWTFAIFGAISFCCFLMRYGWLVPSAVAGLYLGTFCFQSGIGMGSLESQMQERLMRIVVSTVVGLAIGHLLDVVAPVNVNRGTSDSSAEAEADQ